MDYGNKRVMLIEKMRVILERPLAPSQKGLDHADLFGMEFISQIGWLLFSMLCLYILTLKIALLFYPPPHVLMTVVSPREGLHHLVSSHLALPLWRPSPFQHGSFSCEMLSFPKLSCMDRPSTLHRSFLKNG